MPKVTTRHQGDMLFECTAGNHTILSDVPAGAGGKDRAPTGTELLAAALCSCVAATVTFYAARMGADPAGISVDVTYERTTIPYRLTNLKAAIHLPNVTDEARRKALLNAAHHCPVHETIASGEPIEIAIVD